MWKNEAWLLDMLNACRRIERHAQGTDGTAFLSSASMFSGYARVSTTDQDTVAQATALKAADCERIFGEKVSAGRWDCPELQRHLDQWRPRDVLVVWKRHRLSRSLRDLLTLMQRLQATGAGFRRLMEAVDATPPAGRLLMQIVGSLAEFERAMLPERTQEEVRGMRLGVMLLPHRSEARP
jgi:DNA invertase Pin-like site-specific DNA recombinase